MLETARWGGKALPGQDELPSDDGEPTETGFHGAQAALLKDTLIEAWADRHDFFVGGNMFVYFSERQIRSNDFRGPDVFVVLDADPKGRKSWVAWEEGGRLPHVVIELTSESTEKVDRGEKMRIYSRIWRAPCYYLFDPETEKLEGYRLDADHRDYVPLAPDERGDLAVHPLGLKLGLRPTSYRHFEQPFVRWLDQAGNPLPTAQETVAVERARAERERARAEQAEADGKRTLERVVELEARLAELGDETKI
jgi:Uma2 family endonuclease